jgi:excisionase family DNA binding protein
MEQSMNLEEAGKFLGVSPHTLRAWARSKKVRHFKLGRRMIFDRADLEAFLRSNVVELAKKTAEVRSPNNPTVVVFPVIDPWIPWLARLGRGRDCTHARSKGLPGTSSAPSAPFRKPIPSPCWPTS